MAAILDYFYKSVTGDSIITIIIVIIINLKQSTK